MLEYVHNFIGALAFSIFVECLVVVGLSFLLRKDKSLFLVAALGTVCTIPYVWFVFPTIFWYSGSLIVWVGEGLAFVVEAFLYKFVGRLTWRYALLFSLLANLASYALGKI